MLLWHLLSESHWGSKLHFAMLWSWFASSVVGIWSESNNPSMDDCSMDFLVIGNTCMNVEYQGQGMYTNWIGDASLISSGLRSSPNHKVWRKEEMDLHKCTGFSPALFVSISSRYRLFIFDLWSEAGCLEKGETQNFSSSLFACYSCLCIG